MNSIIKHEKKWMKKFFIHSTEICVSGILQDGE